MKIGIGQINTTVGDFKGNISKIKSFARRADDKKCDLVVFPELAVCGYPPKDLLENSDFIKGNIRALGELKVFTKSLGCAVLVGYVGKNMTRIGKPLYNSAALLKNGELIFTQNKSLLPTYDVFDEGRYFEPADKAALFEYAGKKLAISICEDIWNDEDFWKTKRYKTDPIEQLYMAGADIVINISSSPYYLGKRDLKEKMLINVARKYGLPVVYVNLTGGNDELIFEGRSLYIDAEGAIRFRGRAFAESLDIVDTDRPDGTSHADPGGEDELLQALILGTRDYVKKCGFKKAVIGVSGGIDSALVAYIACRALGKGNVLAVNMPSKYSSRGSKDDSRKLASNLGIKYLMVSIEGLHSSYLALFKRLFKGKKADITEENIQARIRANILMAISNKLGHLVLSCGNKSELAVGYTTLYGDLSGGLAVISDLPKTEIYRLAREINSRKEIIPANILKKAPSAELKPDQTDLDTLPPYDDLDRILKLYIEERSDLKTICEKAGNPSLAKRVLKMVLNNEYKRNQAPPGLKVTTKAFGYGRRYPIAHRFKF